MKNLPDSSSSSSSLSCLAGAFPFFTAFAGTVFFLTAALGGGALIYIHLEKKYTQLNNSDWNTDNVLRSWEKKMLPLTSSSLSSSLDSSTSFGGGGAFFFGGTSFTCFFAPCKFQAQIKRFMVIYPRVHEALAVIAFLYYFYSTQIVSLVRSSTLLKTFFTPCQLIWL